MEHKPAILYIDDATESAKQRIRYLHDNKPGLDIRLASSYESVKQIIQTLQAENKSISLIIADQKIDPTGLIDGKKLIEYVRYRMDKTPQDLPAILMSGDTISSLPENTEYICKGGGVVEEILEYLDDPENFRPRNLISYQLERETEINEALEKNIPTPAKLRSLMEQIPTLEDRQKLAEEIRDKISRVENDSKHVRHLNLLSDILNEHINISPSRG